MYEMKDPDFAIAPTTTFERKAAVAVLVVAVVWLACQVLAAVWARSLYGDGAFYVFFHLLTPFQFNDYDYRRSFASYITQAPVLLGQRLGAENVATYAALYSLGTFFVPLGIFVLALFLAKAYRTLFVATLAAIVVFGFGVNFINSEANLFFSLVWLAVIVLSLPGDRPRLRGLVLPLLALVLVRVYEGMLLVGPLLAAWSIVASNRARGTEEKIGLSIAGILFVVGTAVGFSGFIAPRDPANAAGFLSSAFDYFRNPQLFLLLSTTLFTVAACDVSVKVRWLLVAAGFVFAAAFVRGMFRLEGYYSFTAYYYNRAFLVLFLPVFVAPMLVIYYRSPERLANRQGNLTFGWLLVPLIAAVSGDVLGSVRWHEYMQSFCRVLDKRAPPAAGVQQLKQGGARTGWVWTHPTLSVLLRHQGSDAMVLNEQPEGWQPFDPSKDVALNYSGLCDAPMWRQELPARAVTFSFQDRSYPFPIASIGGLSKPEGWARWSDGDTVEIRLSQDLPASFDLTLMTASAFGSNGGAEIPVFVGTQRRSFRADARPTKVTLSFENVRGERTISIQIPKPQSPKDLGLGDDTRQLGIAFVSGSINPK